MDYTGRSLLKFVKVILVLTSVYWCILLSIVACMLLGQPRRPSVSSGPEANLHASLVCIFFVLLSVGGGVLAVLVVAFHFVSQYYWREFDLPRGARGAGQLMHYYSHYTEASDLEWPCGTPPLIAISTHFQRLTNLDTLVPLLCEHGILQMAELETLIEHRCRFDKVSYLLTVLDKKGRAGVSGVIRCLKEDDVHLGHQDLASILEHHYQ